MRIVVTGSGGMLGQDLATCLELNHRVVRLYHADADITNPKQIRDVFRNAKPELVIHAAAITAVDDCELKPDLARAVNAEGTRNVAQACKDCGARLIYISTDYVFDGNKAEPYEETDEPNPLNVYGQSKLQGEKYVLELLQKAWIVRVAWLYGPMGKNFVHAILQQALEGNPIRVVNDQWGSPTYTMDVAESLKQLIANAPPGIYHMTNQGHCSWHEFAQEILRQSQLSRIQVDPISTTGLHRKARRPINSRLANLNLVDAGIGLLPTWQDGLHRCLGRYSDNMRPVCNTVESDMPARNH